MALGKKNQPNGYFETGDLLYVNQASVGSDYNDSVSTKVYTSPQTSSTALIKNGGSFLGVITREKVPDNKYGNEIDWIEYKGADGRSYYVQLDSAVLTSKVNPEYNYPDEEKQKASWGEILGGIGNILGSVFGGKQSTGTTGTSTGTGSQKDISKEVDERTWLQRNALFLIFGTLVTMLIGILLFKPKKKEVPAAGGPVIQLRKVKGKYQLA